MRLKIKHPHVDERHVKHTAGLTILSGTVLEAAHLFYPSGLLLLMVGGCVAVYEPWIVQWIDSKENDSAG